MARQTYGLEDWQPEVVQHAESNLTDVFPLIHLSYISLRPRNPFRGRGAQLPHFESVAVLLDAVPIFDVSVTVCILHDNITILLPRPSHGSIPSSGRQRSSRFVEYVPVHDFQPSGDNDIPLRYHVHQLSS